MELTNIVYLTREQYNTLVREGEVTNEQGVTIQYDPNTEYRVPKLKTAEELNATDKTTPVSGKAVADYVSTHGKTYLSGDGITVDTNNKINLGSSTPVNEPIDIIGGVNGSVLRVTNNDTSGGAVALQVNGKSTFSKDILVTSGTANFSSAMIRVFKFNDQASQSSDVVYGSDIKAVTKAYTGGELQHTLTAGSGIAIANNVISTNIPAAPSEDGTYVLKCTVTDGAPVYEWISE